MSKIVFWQHCYLVTTLLGQGQSLASRSNVRAKVMGQGQISCVQQSILGARLCRVQQRPTALITSQCVCNPRADADNLADVVDQLLFILHYIMYMDSASYPYLIKPTFQIDSFGQTKINEIYTYQIDTQSRPEEVLLVFTAFINMDVIQTEWCRHIVNWKQQGAWEN